jgi:hypothetical protein
MPSAAYDPWTERMRCGDFAGAWQISDAALASIGEDEWRRPRHVQRIWRGGSLEDRRVLIRCYHGLGDSVQFVRYVPMVAQIAQEVTLWIQPALLPLVRELKGVARLIPLHDGTPECDWDIDIELMELPHFFRTTLDTIPREIPYLTIPPDVARPSPSEVPRIGLAWRAGGWDHRRSIPVDLARALVADLPCEVEVLQEWLWPHERMHFKPGTSPSITEVAAAIASVDLVVTIDTVFAHLAGALGRPAWVLLQADPDWRWMRDRDDSPWYPSLRLFRQARPGDWASVITRVRAELKHRLDASARAPEAPFTSASA